MPFKQRITVIFLFLIFLSIRIFRWLRKSGNRLRPYRWRIATAVVLGVFLSAGVYQGWSWHRFATTPLIRSGSTTVIVTPHLTIKGLAAKLHERGLLAHPRFLVLLARQKGEADKLRVGEYAIDATTTPEQLLTHIVTGKVVMRKLTLVEGITMRQIRQQLLSDDALQPVSANQTDQEIMASLGHPGESAEGWFFPDTYLYTWGNKDTVVLQQAYQRMANLLAQEWPQRDRHLPYQSPKEALIVASLVESEAVVPAERPIIAGVIIRRLQKNMNLQVDPTVIYGVGKPYGSPITLSDLRNDNPYNTYLHKGLPPTPINMPSAASIYAALHPTLGDALYYVAQGDGSHRFSATYAEHLQAVHHYHQFKQYQEDKRTWYGIGLLIVRTAGLY